MIACVKSATNTYPNLLTIVKNLSVKGFEFIHETKGVWPNPGTTNDNTYEAQGAGIIETAANNFFAERDSRDLFISRLKKSVLFTLTFGSLYFGYRDFDKTTFKSTIQPYMSRVVACTPAFLKNIPSQWKPALGKMSGFMSGIRTKTMGMLPTRWR